MKITRQYLAVEQLGQDVFSVHLTFVQGGKAGQEKLEADSLCCTGIMGGTHLFTQVMVRQGNDWRQSRHCNCHEFALNREASGTCKHLTQAVSIFNKLKSDRSLWREATEEQTDPAPIVRAVETQGANQ